MELYYKDLISEEASTSLEKLVDDLMLLVQGADEYAQAATAQIAEHKREEIRTRLARIKQHCQRLKDQAVAGARATDKVLRLHPYSSVGIAFAVGFLAGWALVRKQGD